MSNYGITLKQYLKMFEKQKGLCLICLLPEDSIDSRSGKIKNLSVDHCHQTGKIRGLLCASCNHTLGFAKDNIVTFERAIAYLKGEI